MNRRALLALLALPGCSFLPDRPYIETLRFPLAAVRPAGMPRRTGHEAVLVRQMRAGPGLDSRGLRSLRSDGTLASAPYAEWAALPAEAAEAALRDWLRESGLFAGVAQPGSRITATLVLESELIDLVQDSPTSARAAISALLLEEPGLTATRLRGQFVARGRANLQGAGPAAAAAAMSAALVAALTALESELTTILNTPPARR